MPFCGNVRGPPKTSQLANFPEKRTESLKNQLSLRTPLGPSCCSPFPLKHVFNLLKHFPHEEARLTSEVWHHEFLPSHFHLCRLLTRTDERLLGSQAKPVQDIRSRLGGMAHWQLMLGQQARHARGRGRSGC